MAGRGCDWVGAVWRRLGLGPAAGRAAAPPSLILPLSRRSAAATWPSWPGRSAAVADSAVPSEQASATSQCTLHSCTVRDRRRKCRIDSIEIYSRVLNSKLRSRSGFVRQWAAPLWPRCAAALGRRCGRFGCCRRGGDWDITGSGRPSGCAAVADTAAATWPGRSGRSGRRTTATGNGTAPRGQACFRSLERAAALPVGTCQQHGRMMGP